MMIRLAKPVVLSLFFIVLMCSKSYCQEPLTLKNTLTLATGEIIELPIPPGFFRVDGVSEEVDKYYAIGTIGNETIENMALYISDISNWSDKLLKFFEDSKYRPVGESGFLSPVFPPFDMIEVDACDRAGKFRKKYNASVEEILEIKKRNGLSQNKSNYAFGNIPETLLISCRTPVHPDSDSNYAYYVATTYLKGVFIDFEYSPRGREMHTPSKEEVKAQEEMLIIWLNDIRRTCLAVHP